MEIKSFPKILTESQKEQEKNKSGKLNTTVHIFEHHYKVKVPTLMSRSIQDLQVNGVILSGNRDFDKGIENELSLKWMTIDQMVEHFKQGCPVYITLYKDTKNIYEVIHLHLQTWAEYLNKGVNIGDAPIDDLMQLDAFAESIFEYAKYQYANSFLEDPIIQNLMRVSKYNFHNFFSNPTTTVRTSTGPSVIETSTGVRIGQENQDVPRRESLKDFFRDKSISLRRY